MDKNGVLFAMRRRWYVLLAGTLLTLGTLVLLHTPPVYTGQVTLVIISRHLPSTQNAIAETTPSAIASMTVIMVNNGPVAPDAASSDARLFGRGVDAGTSIRMRTGGSQWALAAGLPYIDIDAVDHSAAQVERRLVAAVAKVHDALIEQQDRLGVRPSDRVALEQTPQVPLIAPVATQARRADAVVLVVGIAVTASLVRATDSLRPRRAARRRNRRARTAPAGP